MGYLLRQSVTDFSHLVRRLGAAKRLGQLHCNLYACRWLEYDTRIFPTSIFDGNGEERNLGEIFTSEASFAGTLRQTQQDTFVTNDTMHYLEGKMLASSSRTDPTRPKAQTTLNRLPFACTQPHPCRAGESGLRMRTASRCVRVRSPEGKPQDQSRGPPTLISNELAHLPSGSGACQGDR